MHFNISYDLISLVVLSIITYRFFKLKQFPVFSNKLFGVLLLLGIGNLLLDISGSLLVREGSTSPVWLAVIVNVLYYIVLLAFPAALVVYMLALLENRGGIDRTRYVWALVPCCVFLLLFLVGMPLKLVFTISDDLVYSYGPLSFITYACLVVYLCIIVFVLLKNKAQFSAMERLSLWALTLFISIACGLQYLFPSELLSGSAIAVSFLIMYFTMQDPSRMLDSDTGLFNAQAFNALFGRKGNSTRTVHIAAVKLHGLFNIYMLRGHETGDLALKNFGEYLQSLKNAWSFRTGDSLFMICFRKESELDAFARQFERDRVNRRLFGQCEMTPDLTVVCIRNAERLRTAEEMMTVAEGALDVEDIDSVKNKIVYLGADEINNYKRSLVIEDEIRTNIKTGEGFQTYFQPIYSTSDKSFVSAEVLSRYQSNTLGRLSPNEFIPVIENKGMALDFDEMLVRSVFSQIESGAFRGLGLRTIHINLSAASFGSEVAISRILSLAKKYDINPSFVIFEITETAATFSDSTLEQNAKLLRRSGFGLALDDFGMGYSNILRVCGLPFTHVKLDKGLIQDPSNIVTNVVNLFKNFYTEIVAEGVETEEQLAAVTESGVSLIQGYYFAKPMPFEDMSAMLKKYKKYEG